MSGKIEWIGVRPERKAPVFPKDEVFISSESGIEGDHETQPHRQVTLISSEHLLKAAQELGRDAIDPAATRRNILISGLDFDQIREEESRIRIGEAIVKVTGYCHPCERMNSTIGDGGRLALAHKAGLTASVEQSGSLAIGDSAEVL